MNMGKVYSKKTILRPAATLPAALIMVINMWCPLKTLMDKSQHRLK